jgi:endonuclease IV
MIDISREDLQNEWRNPYLQWWAAGMPSYETLNLEPWKQLTIQFKTMDDRIAFAELLGIELTDRTNGICYPEKNRHANINNGYVDENEL